MMIKLDKKINIFIFYKEKKKVYQSQTIARPYTCTTSTIRSRQNASNTTL